MENILYPANRKRRIKKAVIVILVFLYCIRWYSNCVKSAIFMWQALVQKDNINYFVVGRSGFWGEGELGYLNGTKLIPVFLTGRAPDSELSGGIFKHGRHGWFLVKGHIDQNLSEVAGRDVIMVEEWEIIAPIFRHYEIEDPATRIFTPRFYLDQYDVEVGMYFQIVADLRAIRWFEEERIINESALDCCVITSDIIDNEVQWYLVEDKEKIPIHLTGYPLETHFNEKILSGCLNRFLVEGTLEKDDHEMFVENWYIKYPISRYGDTSFHYSRYYFVEQDILDGVYIP